MIIAFKALIKQITIKSLVSGDKEAELRLRLQDENVDDSTLNALNALQRADKQAYITVSNENDDT